MNKADEIIYMGRLISLLGKHNQLSLGEIKNKTKAFLKKRHQTNSSLFNTLESFVELGVLKRVTLKSRIYYALGQLTTQPDKTSLQADIVESGLSTESELFRSLANAALRTSGKKPLSEDEPIETVKHKYVPKEPPPTDVKGFK